MHEDTQLMYRFLDICHIIKPKISIEVGGFDAVYSQEIAKYDFCEEVYVYEANPYVYEHFLPIFPPKIKYENIAISDYQGTANLGLESILDPIQGHFSIKTRPDRNIEETIGVTCSSLDFLHLYAPERKIAMWIDCEGSNREVLLGARNLLSNVEALLIETEHYPFWQDQWLHDDVVEYLSTFGFLLFSQTPYGEMQSNCIFLKKFPF